MWAALVARQAFVGRWMALRHAAVDKSLHTRQERADELQVRAQLEPRAAPKFHWAVVCVRVRVRVRGAGGGSGCCWRPAEGRPGSRLPAGS